MVAYQLVELQGNRRNYATPTGFVEVAHYYRPPGPSRHEQRWLATVWRKA